jgi:hypothetical protein
MSGHMVTAAGAGHRNFYMVNIADPKQACAKVDKLFTVASHALAPMSDVTLAHHDVGPGQIWICSTVREDNGKVTSSGFSDAKGGGRMGIRG